GAVCTVAAAGFRFNDVTSIVMTGADGISVSGANGIIITDGYGLVATAGNNTQSGLQTVDPELALQLNQLTDDSSVNAVVVYYHLPTDADLADLQRLGVVGGTRYHVLPMVTITSTRAQIVEILELASVRSI